MDWANAYLAVPLNYGLLKIAARVKNCALSTCRIVEPVGAHFAQREERRRRAWMVYSGPYSQYYL